MNNSGLIKLRCEFELDDGTIINLMFENTNLPHLLGFQYLDTAHSLFRSFNDKTNRKITAENIMSKLINGGVTFEELKSQNLLGVENERRIEEFTYNNIMGILRGITTFRFIYDSKRPISKKAKFVFIEKRNRFFIHLYIGYDTPKKYYFPLSFQPSDKKEQSLERKPKYIIKTTIFHDTDGEPKVEVLNHIAMRPVIDELSKDINQFNKLNDLLYRKLDKGQDTSTLLIEVDACFREVEQKYLELSTMINMTEYLMRRNNMRMKKFFDKYPDRFSKH